MAFRSISFQVVKTDPFKYFLCSYLKVIRDFSMSTCVRSTCVCICVCVCLHPFHCVCVFMKASSVWNSWNVREQINDVVQKTFLFSAKSFHCYFRMKHQEFLSSQFILLPYQNREKPQLSQCVSRFQVIRSSFTVIRYHPCSTLHCKLIYLWRQDS